jgi:hypothetical protein
MIPGVRELVPPTRAVEHTAGTEVIQRDDYFARLEYTGQEYQRTNGSLIRVYQFKESDRQTPKRFVISLSTSESPESEILTVPIIGSENWATIDSLRPLLKQLQFAEGLQITDTFQRLRRHSETKERAASCERPLVFRGTDPTSAIINTVLENAKRELWSGPEPILLVQRREDRRVFEAAWRILERKDVVEIRFRKPALTGNSWERLYVALDDKGRGSILLCVGSKDLATAHSDEQGSVSAGEAIYSVDLSSLEDTDRYDWMMEMLACFVKSHVHYPGAITSFLSKTRSSDGPDSEQLATLDDTRHLHAEHLDPDTSLKFFTKQIVSIFKRREVDVRILAEESSSVIVECTNKTKRQDKPYDRLEITVRPHGIDELYVLSRGSANTSELSVGFHLASIYQLHPADFDNRLVDPIAKFLNSEGGITQSCEDSSGSTAHNIGARKVFTYLNNRLSLHARGGAGKNFACVSPPSLKERCEQSSSLVGQILKNRTNGA